MVDKKKWPGQPPANKVNTLTYGGGAAIPVGSNPTILPADDGLGSAPDTLTLVAGGVPATIVVAGLPRTGTTVCVKMFLDSGVPGLYRKLAHPERPYPYQVYEYAGGLLQKEHVQGRVVKRFNDTLVDDLPQDIGPVYVLYIWRDWDAFQLAHPGRQFENSGEYYNHHMKNITRITNDPRVEKFTLVDFDNLQDQPRSTVRMLINRGYPLIEDKAVAAIDPSLRHARRGDTEIRNRPEAEMLKQSKKAAPVIAPELTDQASIRIALKHAKRMGGGNS